MSENAFFCVKEGDVKLKKLMSRTIAVSVIVFLLVLSFVAIFINNQKTSTDAWAVITVDGKEVEKYDLSKDYSNKIVDLSSYEGAKNVKLLLDNHTISFYESDCSDKICVNTGKLSKLGDIAVCLPNKVICAVVSQKQATGKNMGTNDAYSAQFIDTFNTVIQISGYAQSDEDFAKYSYYAHQRFIQLSKYFDRFYEYSGVNNIRTINSKAGIEPVKVDKVLYDLIDFGIKCDQMSKGKVDISKGTVIALWTSYIEKYSGENENTEIPDINTLKSLDSKSDISHIQLNPQEHTVYITTADTMIDVGAIAKGYATQIVANELYEMGLKSFYISAGGNIVVKDPPPGKDHWTIGIQNPDSQELNDYVDSIDSVKVTNMSVVTSGDYQRFYYYNGERMHHIIDFDTLMPAKLYRSVSIICNDSGFADFASTALFVMDYESGLKFAKDNNIDAIWIFADKTIKSTMQ